MVNYYLLEINLVNFYQLHCTIFEERGIYVLLFDPIRSRNGLYIEKDA